LDGWLKSHGLPAIAGLDTRALTHRIRDLGAPSGCLAHLPSGTRHADFPDGLLQVAALRAKAAAFPGLEGLDLAKEVCCTQSYRWDQTTWSLEAGHGRQTAPRHRVVAVDFGAKRNILRCLASAGCAVTVVPATATAEDIMAHRPDGVFLSNGPGDPAATGVYAVPMVQALLQSGLPIFGICLGHQILALALGASTRKMHLGHRGANHPVKDLATGQVEITSQNHGFEIVGESLPAGVVASHVSLFDGSNEGLALAGRPVFSVQYHPEASPGPQDSHHLFERFVALIEERKKAA
jgi:carbamoyl-phosphate synthase small subunit